jgi:hypothetical protein
VKCSMAGSLPPTGRMTRPMGGMARYAPDVARP